MTRRVGCGTRMVSIKRGRANTGHLRINLSVDARITRDELDEIIESARRLIEARIAHYNTLPEEESDEK